MNFDVTDQWSITKFAFVKQSRKNNVGCCGLVRKSFNLIYTKNNPLFVHISNVLFYQVLLHIHCKQLGSKLAFYESIYVRPVFLN